MAWFLSRRLVAIIKRYCSIQNFYALCFCCTSVITLQAVALVLSQFCVLGFESCLPPISDRPKIDVLEKNEKKLNWSWTFSPTVFLFENALLQWLMKLRAALSCFITFFHVPPPQPTYMFILINCFYSQQFIRNFGFSVWSWFVCAFPLHFKMSPIQTNALPIVRQKRFSKDFRCFLSDEQLEACRVQIYMVVFLTCLIVHMKYFQVFCK